MVRSLLICVEYGNTRLQQKAAQAGFIARALRAHSKSRAQFSQNDKRQPHFVSKLDRFNNGSITATKIRITIGIDGNSQSQRSSSIVC